MAEISPNERLLRDMFPDQATLSPEDLAQALMGKRSRGVANGIRAKLRNEDLVPGLRKVGNVWRIPIGKAAKVLDDLTATPPPPPLVRSKRAVQGPIFLLRRQRNEEFFSAVLEAYRVLEAAAKRQALTAVSERVRGPVQHLCPICGEVAHEGPCRKL